MTSFSDTEVPIADDAGGLNSNSNPSTDNGQDLASNNVADTEASGGGSPVQGRSNVGFGGGIRARTNGGVSGHENQLMPGEITDDLNSPTTPIQTGKRIRKAPHVHRNCHCHSSKCGESEDAFFVGIATAKKAPNSATPLRKKKKERSRKQKALANIPINLEARRSSQRNGNAASGSREETAISLVNKDDRLVSTGALTAIASSPRALTRVSFSNSSPTWQKWSCPSGVAPQKHLAAAINDKEDSKNMANGNPNKRGINLELFAHVIWCVASFVCVRRHLKTRAKAIVKCIFQVLAGCSVSGAVSGCSDSRVKSAPTTGGISSLEVSADC